MGLVLLGWAWPPSQDRCTRLVIQLMTDLISFLKATSQEEVVWRTGLLCRVLYACMASRRTVLASNPPSDVYVEGDAVVGCDPLVSQVGRYLPDMDP